MSQRTYTGDKSAGPQDANHRVPSAIQHSTGKSPRRGSIDPDPPVIGDSHISAHKHITNTPRVFNDPARLRDLATFARGLQLWAEQFPIGERSVSLVTASVISHHGVTAVMRLISERLGELAPRDSSAVDGMNVEAVGDVRRGDALTPSEQQSQLRKTINYFDLLGLYLAGSLSCDPDYEYPYDHLPADVPWSWSWIPADKKTGKSVERRFAKAFKSRAGGDGDPAKASQRLHDRVGRLSRGVLQDFATFMETDERAGYPAVREAMEGRVAARAKAARKRLAATTRKLMAFVADSDQPILPFGRPSQAFMAVDAIEQFCTAAHEYIEHGLAVLRVTTSSRQMLRNMLGRRIAVVVQYAYLSLGNFQSAWFDEIVRLIRAFATDLAEDVATLTAGLQDSSTAAQECQRIVAELNRSIVDPVILERWRVGLGKNTRRAGEIVAAITVEDPRQTHPWPCGDMVPRLVKRGLIKRSASKRDARQQELREMLFPMQSIGLAVQVDWLYLQGRGEHPGGGSKHSGLPWLVNPLGAVLIDGGSGSGSKRRRAETGTEKATSGNKSASGKAGGKQTAATSRKTGRRSSRTKAAVGKKATQSKATRTQGRSA